MLCSYCFFIVKILSIDLNGWTDEILHSSKPLFYIYSTEIIRSINYSQKSTRIDYRRLDSRKNLKSPLARASAPAVQ